MVLSAGFPGCFTAGRMWLDGGIQSHVTTRC
jgi:hypothetical protein